MLDESRRSITIAITGASGALYAVRTVAALLERAFHVELVVSDFGRRLLMEELSVSADRLLPHLLETYGATVERGSLQLHSNKDLGAGIASGSHGCDGMVIVPWPCTPAENSSSNVVAKCTPCISGRGSAAQIVTARLLPVPKAEW